MKKIPKPILFGGLVIVLLFICVVVAGGSGGIQLDPQALIERFPGLGSQHLKLDEIQVTAVACLEREAKQVVISKNQACVYYFPPAEAEVRALELEIRGAAKVQFQLTQKDAVTVDKTLSTLPENRPTPTLTPTHMSTPDPAAKTLTPTPDNPLVRPDVEKGNAEPLSGKMKLDVFKNGGQLRITCVKLPELSEEEGKTNPVQVCILAIIGSE